MLQIVTYPSERIRLQRGNGVESADLTAKDAVSPSQQGRTFQPVLWRMLWMFLGKSIGKMGVTRFLFFGLFFTLAIPIIVLSRGIREGEQPYVIGIFVLGLIMLAIGVPWFRRDFRIFQNEYPAPVTLTKDGLQWVVGGETQSRRWDQVRAVYRSGEVLERDKQQLSDYSSLFVKLDDDTTLNYAPQIEDYRTFADELQHRSDQARKPVALAEMQKGGANFGPISLTTDSIIHKEEAFLLSQLESIHIGKSQVWLKIALSEATIANGVMIWQVLGGRKHSIALDSVPNYKLLIELLRGMVGDRLTDSFS
ncbi:MAG: DUF6585 family protein [Fimbriiglobus sp.]